MALTLLRAFILSSSPIGRSCENNPIRIIKVCIYTFAFYQGCKVKTINNILDRKRGGGKRILHHRTGIITIQGGINFGQVMSGRQKICRQRSETVQLFSQYTVQQDRESIFAAMLLGQSTKKCNSYFNV